MQTLIIVLMLAFSSLAGETPADEKVVAIESDGMAPFLQDGEKVIVAKDYYKNHPVVRGDVIVFKDPKGTFRIKRVISISGETMEYSADTLYINNKPIDEPYLAEHRLKIQSTGRVRVTEDYGPYTIPKGEVFVLGDNRLESYDSRFFGTIKSEQIVAKVLRKLPKQPAS